MTASAVLTVLVYVYILFGVYGSFRAIRIIQNEKIAKASPQIAKFAEALEANPMFLGAILFLFITFLWLPVYLLSFLDPADVKKQREEEAEEIHKVVNESCCNKHQQPPDNK